MSNDPQANRRRGKGHRVDTGYFQGALRASTLHTHLVADEVAQEADSGNADCVCVIKHEIEQRVENVLEEVPHTWAVVLRGLGQKVQRLCNVLCVHVRGQRMKVCMHACTHRLIVLRKSLEGVAQAHDVTISVGQ